MSVIEAERFVRKEAREICKTETERQPVSKNHPQVWHGHHIVIYYCMNWNAVSPNIAYINGIVITLAIGMFVAQIRTFPRLRNSAVIPNIAVVWKTVVDKTRNTLLFILYDWVQAIFFTDFHLGVRPTRNFNHHIYYGFLK